MTVRRPLAIRGLLAAVSLALGAGLVAGCGGSGYHYVKNSGAGAYFKVPGDWKVYDEDAYYDAAGEGMSAREADQLREAGWTVAFDADPDPSVANIRALVADHPTGVAQIFPMTEEQHDEASLKWLRNVLVDVDGAIEDGTASVFDYEERSFEGFRGSRFVFSLETEEGIVVFDQTAYVDDEASKLYLLAMSCGSPCYDSYEKKIDAIAESWTLKER